jgi:type II secretory pathway pseudopilin PulG
VTDAPSGGTSEDGFTLVEVVLAVAILTLAVVAIAAGMGTSIIASDHHRRQVDANAVLIRAAEKVKSPSTSYADCPPTPADKTGYEIAARNISDPPAGWNLATAISVTSIQYWDGFAFTATCSENPQNPLLALQLITLEVRSPAGAQERAGQPATENVSFVKRRCRATQPTTVTPNTVPPCPADER